MIEIPVKVGVTVEETRLAVLEALEGNLEGLNKIFDSKGRKLVFETQFKVTGEKEVTSLGENTDRTSGSVRKLGGEIQRLTRTQEGSLTSLRQAVNSYKQKRDALAQTNAKYAEYDDKLKQATSALQAALGIQKGSIAALQIEKKELQDTINKQSLSTQERYKAVQSINALNSALRQASGIQKGSLADLQAQRDELVRLRDATARFPSVPPAAGQGWADLNKRIQAVDAQIAKTTPGFNRFFSTLSRIATVQAGFVAIASGFNAITGALNAYVNRTKQLQAFDLALKNVGLNQVEVNKTFADATAIADRLGAPVQQVEKSYKRMLPALIAVGASAETSSQFIENITARTQTLGLNTEESGRLFEAFAQVLSKGKLQAEELNQQISELDGSFRTQLADALGVSTEKLTELVEQGAITAPVFVDAVNKMSNGVEELQRRIESGNATIQQLQNNIQNINLQTLTRIGAAIEPAIKSFLAIGKAVSEFFDRFSQTKVFGLFVVILNQTAKGLEVFVSNLLKVVDVIVELLSPLANVLGSILDLGKEFGGLIGIIVNIVGVILTLKAAIVGLNILKTASSNAVEFGKSLIGAGNSLKELQANAKSANLTGLAGALEKIKNVSGGVISGLAKTTGSFLGIKASSSAAAGGLQTTAKAGTSLVEAMKSDTRYLQLFSNLQKAGLTTNKQFSDALGLTAIESGKVSFEINKAGSNIAYGSSQAQKAGGIFANFGNQIQAAGKKAKLASIDFRGIGANLAIGLAINEGVNLVSDLFNFVNAGAEEAKAVTRDFSESLFLMDEAIRKASISAEQTDKSMAVASESIGQAAASSEAAGKSAAVASTGLRTLAIVAFGAAGAIFTGGGSLVVALAAAAAGGIAAAGASNQAKKAVEELGKAKGGKALLKQFSDFDKKLGSFESKVEGLGGSIGQLDFSKFAKGSTNLTKLGQAYNSAVPAIESYISGLDAQIQKEREGENREGVIKGLEAEKQKRLEQLELLKASQTAINNEIAARIAQGAAVDATAISLEQLTQAQKLADSAINQGTLEAKTAALKKYGTAADTESQREGARLAIELGASQARLQARQNELNLLEEKARRGAVLTAEEQAKAQELTGTIAEETNKQAELTNEFGQALVDAFERGIEKVREIGDVYGEIASKTKTVFDGISGGAASELQAALGLVNAVAEKEKQGLAENSVLRQNIARYQLQAAARVAEAENQIAQTRLRVQTIIGINEARIAQLRLQAEAKIAEARGESDLAQALTQAAGLQGTIIQGLKDQYQIESQVLSLQKQQSDQALIQQGLQDGLYANSKQAAQSLGVQNVTLGEASKKLEGIVSSSKQISDKYGNIATSASDAQTAVEGTQLEEAADETERLREGFKEAKNSVDNAIDSAKKLATRFSDIVSKAINLRKELQQVDGLLNGKGGGAQARAMGGPVSSGQQYFVNDGGGREAFINQFGRFSMLPAGRNLNWTAPTSGFVVPASMVDAYRNRSVVNNRINNVTNTSSPRPTRAAATASTVDSGNLVKQVVASMGSTGATQRITNNVTIQSQEPVMDASRIMTNVAKMRLRSRRIG